MSVNPGEVSKLSGQLAAETRYKGADTERATELRRQLTIAQVKTHLFDKLSAIQPITDEERKAIDTTLDVMTEQH